MQLGGYVLESSEHGVCRGGLEEWVGLDVECGQHGGEQTGLGVSNILW